MRYARLQLFLFLMIFISAGLFYSCTEKAPAHEEVKAATEIVWQTDLEQAIQAAASENKPLMIDFMATWCPPCKKMEDSTFNQQAVIEKSQQFITLRIDVDLQPEVAKTYKSNAQKYGGIGIPNILFLSPDQKELAHPIGYLSPAEITAIMDSVLTVLNMDK